MGVQVSFHAMDLLESHLLYFVRYGPLYHAILPMIALTLSFMS